MTSTSSANDTALPTIIEPTPRRGFLRQLASLSLIGGSVKLLGAPTAVAEPVTDSLLWGYKEWLFYEHRMLSYELAGYNMNQAKFIERHSLVEAAPGVGDWHFNFPGVREGAPLAGWPETPFQPSTRAALVLAAVGCDWREGQSLDRRRA